MRGEGGSVSKLVKFVVFKIVVVFVIKVKSLGAFLFSFIDTLVMFGLN